jgi:serine/threonine-protein kinase
MSALPDVELPLAFELPVGTEIGGRYRVERLLATGGMATIYVAEDVSLERRVALKVLRPGAGNVTELVHRFWNEARAIAKLRSRHVTQVLDCGMIHHPSASDIPFLVLELLDGVDLWAVLRQEGRLTAAMTAQYTLEACEGLAESHAMGIVHRDLKPENLFVTREVNGTQTIKLLDFGVSKAVGQSGVRPLTKPSECVGSPQYMSPEQMRALPVDERTDIWALGAVMFECAAGRPVFEGSTVFEISAQVLSAPMPDLRVLNPELPEEFIRIVERCLERNPEKRYQNVAELAQALEPLAELEQVGAAERIAKILGVKLPQAVAVSFSPQERISDMVYVDVVDVESVSGKSAGTGNDVQLGAKPLWGVGLSAVVLASGVFGCWGYFHFDALRTWVASSLDYVHSLFWVASH